MCLVEVGRGTRTEFSGRFGRVSFRISANLTPMARTE